MIEFHAGGSCRSRAAYVAARLVIRPLLGFFPYESPLKPAMGLVDGAFGLIPRHPGVTHERVEGDGWHAELIKPRKGGLDNGSALVYFHGGAFLLCGMATHRRVAERLALDTGLPVLNVAYRQGAPHYVDTSIADSLAAVDWMAEQGYAADRLVLAGDSAGGHLSVAVAQRVAARGGQVAGIVAISPWLEFDNVERRIHRNAWRDGMIPTFRLERIARSVTGHDTVDPALSPLNGRLADLPPTLITASGWEVLLNDAIKMEARLVEAGVPVDLHVWDGQLHAFPVATHLLPESRAALDLITDFVSRTIGVDSLALADELAS